MAEAKTDQEPSIEEILESIRQIISEDGEAPAAPSTMTVPPEPKIEDISFDPVPAPVPPPVAANAPVAPPAAEQDDDILDLTEKAVPSNPPRIEMHDIPPEPAYESTYEYTPETETAGAGGSLVSDMTADISAHAMAKLLAGNVSVEREVPGRPGPVTLEDMTRELLRPMLKSWLDQNLPPIIERQVAKEIEKISRLAMKQ